MFFFPRIIPRDGVKHRPLKPLPLNQTVRVDHRNTDIHGPTTDQQITQGVVDASMCLGDVVEDPQHHYAIVRNSLVDRADLSLA